MTSIKVLIIDDHALFCRGVAELLRQREDLELVGQAQDGVDALALMRRAACDLVLLDMEMPRLDGPGFVRAMREQGRSARIVVVSQSCEDERLEQMIDLGVDGHVLKSDDPGEVLRAIDAVLAGRRYFSSRIGERFLQMLRGSQRAPAALSRPSLPIALSPREQSIVTLLAKGMTNKAVAQALGCSEHTVKCHKSNLMRKVGAQNTAEIVAWVSRHGLLS